MGEAFEGLFDSGNVLERVGVELTALARRGDLEPVPCRDAEVARAADILLRQSKKNPSMIGKAGQGSASIVQRLAAVIAAVGGPTAHHDGRSPARDHVAVGMTDDAVKSAIVLADGFVPERARPDKAIDVLDEACAHAQATAAVGAELDRLIRERRKVDAMIRRGLTHETPQHEPAEDLVAEIFPMLERIGAEIEKMLGGERRGEGGGGGGGEGAVRPPPPPPRRPRPPPPPPPRRAPR